MIGADHPIHSDDARRWGHTLPGRVLLFARHWPERVALREKYRGLWREYRWRDYLAECLGFAEALKADGVGEDGRVAIISDNRPEWLFADIGTQFNGAVAAGIYATNPAADVAYVLNHCRAAVVVCEDQEQVDKVIDSPEPLPYLKRIVVIEAEGTAGYEDPRLVRWDDFLSAGRDDDTLLSYLPLCHVAEKIFSQFTPLTTGAVVHFGESLDTVRQDLVEVSPTVFLGVPRIWEKVSAGVDVGIRNTTPLKRRLYQWAVGVGRRHFEARQAGAVGAGLRLQHRLADWLVLRALRERLGMGRCRLAVSGAAPIAPELITWYHHIGVAIMEGWGLSESCGISHLNRPQAFRLGSVGRPAGGVECRLADDGEVLIRGPHLFTGYLDNAEATAEAIDDDGWLHTGDIGTIDEDGYLFITGRKKEILITAGGKNLSPNKIENALKTSPYIKEAASVGDGKPFVSALIQIEPDLVGDWAGRRGVNYTSFEDLAARPEVVKLIDGEVRKANEQLARVEQVRAFRLLPKELHQDDGEVTATQKLKRRVVYEKFAELIDEIYASKEAS